MRIRNEAWKEYRYDYEWVIVCDMDEFLWHPDLKNKLENFRKKLCVSIPRVEGYQMFAEDFPEADGSQIYEKVGRGFADPEHLNKFMIFSPKGVDINYDPGCHTAQPTGDVHYSTDEDKLYLLHYKYVGYDYFIDKNKALAARVGDDDKERHWAFHYEQDAKMTKEEFMKFVEKTRQIVGNEKRIPVDWEAMRRESDYIYYEIMHENQYQVKKEDFVGKNVIDVGANTGIFSLLAYESGAEKIVVVEPNPETLKLLHKNTEDKKEITVLEKAVGLSDEGFVEVCKWDDWTPIDGKCYTKKTEQGVGTVTMDTLVKTVGDDRPILLKVDCEGGEYDLFYGASLEALSKINTIVIEMHQDVPGREGQKNLIEPLRHFITSLGFKEKFAWEYVPKKVWIFRFDRITQTYKPNRKNIEVTVGIPTKNRCFSTLPITLLSVITQTHKPKKIIIVDDSDTEKDGKMKDLRNDPMYQYFFPMLAKKGIEWEVVFGPKKGQHHSHQIIMDKAKTEFVWRLDDDEYAEPTALENLVAEMKAGVGAVGGLVLDPKVSQKAPPGYMNHNKLADIKARENTQWLMHPPGRTMEVEHLYSSFLYRKVEGIGYCLELEKCAHREETIFSHEYVRKGYKLIVTTSAITWHFRNPEGGIRSYSDPNLWAHDEEIFKRKLESWQIDMEGKKLWIADCGIGDTIVAMEWLPELLKKYQNLIIATYYPSLFKKFPNVKILHPWQAKDILGQKVAELQNVYKLLWDESAKGNKLTLKEAYRILMLEKL
jgi:FkbM family methyltransferase